MKNIYSITFFPTLLVGHNKDYNSYTIWNISNTSQRV